MRGNPILRKGGAAVRRRIQGLPILGVKADVEQIDVRNRQPHFSPGAMPATDGARVTIGKLSKRTRSSRITLAVTSLTFSWSSQRSIQ